MQDPGEERSAAPATLVYRPVGRGPALARTAGVTLLVLGALLIVVGLSHGGDGLGAVFGGLVLALISLWAISVLRQRVVVDETTLVVQGRFARVRVDLATVEAVHEDPVRSVWVSATGQRPFTISFVTGGSEPPFVPEVRRRAIACGASLDADAELIARLPRGTRRFFTL